MPIDIGNTGKVTDAIINQALHRTSSKGNSEPTQPAEPAAVVSL
jgi:hypothetical protein|tara:strand:+ start:210 stop:341 length:132 start_codon:yes stop_codon:yes gene_type:complete